MTKASWFGCGMAWVALAAAVGACGNDSGATSDAGGGQAGADQAQLGGDGPGEGGQASGNQCGAGEAYCAGQCVDTASNAEHCGDCGNACSLKAADSVCVEGACAIEACGDGFVDCNGRAADGCEVDDSGLPGRPRLLAPAIGEYTGSALAESSLTPLLRWMEASLGTCGSLTYQVQMDDSCAADALPCDFESPELDETGVDGLELRPKSPLPVATDVPVGTQYFWRVRACEGTSRCSDWSETRYLNVGRLRDDLNGDGHSDVFALSQDGESTLHMHLRPGPAEAEAPDSLARPTLNLPSTVDTFTTARFLGDINGDGFADAARSTSAGAELLLGGPDFAAIAPIKLAGGFVGNHDVASVGDWNGDGFADFALSDNVGTETPPSVVHVYAGNAEAVFDSPLDIKPPVGTTVGSFGVALEGGGDFDGDGYTDLFILDGDEGRIHFVGGGAQPVAKIKASLSTGASCPYYLNPALSRAGDMNGDGYAEIAARCDLKVMVFAGARTPELTPIWSHTFADSAKFLGHGVIGGFDLGSDGLADLLLHGDAQSGTNLFLLAGSETLSDADALLDFGGSLDAQGTARADRGLSTGDYDGDGRPDLLVQPYNVGDLRLFVGGKAISGGACPAMPEVLQRVNDWCRLSVQTIEGKYATQYSPNYPIGGTFGFVLGR